MSAEVATLPIAVDQIEIVATSYPNGRVEYGLKAKTLAFNGPDGKMLPQPIESPAEMDVVLAHVTEIAKQIALNLVVARRREQAKSGPKLVIPG